jgi:hypothetical protein
MYTLALLAHCHVLVFSRTKQESDELGAAEPGEAGTVH